MNKPIELAQENLENIDRLTHECQSVCVVHVRIPVSHSLSVKGICLGEYKKYVISIKGEITYERT